MARRSHLNIRNLIFGHHNRLKYVIRFGTCHRVWDESVAEHSYYVALYALLIGLHLKLSPSDLCELLTRCLLHDVEESRSGDFPRPFKYSTPKLKRELDKASLAAFRQAMEWTIERCEGRDGTRIFRYVEKRWSQAKKGVLGHIVSFADFLSVLSYLCQEINGSNVTMRMHVNDMREYFHTFKSNKFDFIRDLVQQTGLVLNEVLGEKS